jgi:tRNA 5-methylaminomethyl-2-thiouridine biosynthesis bifunctional protein
VPVADGFVFGATHDRDQRGDAATAEDRLRNLKALAQTMPHLAETIEAETLQSRAATRVMSLDLMPVIGEIAPQIWLFSALGSRGFCSAPLMAKWLLDMITGHTIDAHEDVKQSVTCDRYAHTPFILHSS